MYKLIIADSDTPLFKAAKSVQEDYIDVTFPDGVKQEMKNVTALWGHHKKKAHGWLEQHNIIREDKGLPPVLPEQLVVEHCSRLLPDIDHMAEAEMQFDFFVGKLKKTRLAEDYLLVIGGEGNFRYDVATLQPYKGKRKAKPLLFQEIKDMILKKYRKRIVLANGEEADDVLGIMGYQNYINYRKTGKWDNILSYIDKDIDMVMSPSWNYDDDIEADLDVRIPTNFECAKCFAVQLLCGDKSTDNIPGLPNITPELRKKYSLGQQKGVGKTTALGMLAGCETAKELFERVVEAYRDYYDGSESVAGYGGEMLFYNYLDYLQENAILLWMRRIEGEMFDIRQFLTKMGIHIEEEEDVKAISGRLSC